MSQIVACPKCSSRLQLPAGFAGGQIKCPKCSQVLAVGAPNSPAPASPTPAPDPFATGNMSPGAATNDPFGALPSNPAGAPGDPFGNLPAPSAGPMGPQSFPSAGGAVYQPPSKAPNAMGTPRRKSQKGKGSGARKVLGVLGSGFGVLLLVCGGIATVGKLMRGHSGWKSTTFHGYTINMPGKGKQKQQTQAQGGVTAHEITGQRAESGSQYALVVAKMPRLPDGSPFQLMHIRNNPMMRIKNAHDITRGGVPGIAGEISRGLGSLTNAEIEVFMHNGNMVLIAYAPYHLIKDQVGGTMKPRSNERELDKPDEFFESLKFP